ncbi:hypothetical protein CAL61_17005 [Enterobacter hormaechei]|nr:hypothetical protein BET69_16995 [Enterobacter hormaechei]AWQ58806.1 hypothetical protein CAL61_17005 [Enterobacter hormaechei]
MCRAGFLYFTGHIRIIIWWSWRELNPRPKFLHTILTIMKTYNYQFKQYVSITPCLCILLDFKLLPPFCRLDLN